MLDVSVSYSSSYLSKVVVKSKECIAVRNCTLLPSIDLWTVSTSDGLSLKIVDSTGTKLVFSDEPGSVRNWNKKCCYQIFCVTNSKL